MSGPVVTQADRDLWDELLYIWRMEFDPDGHRAIARHREASVAAKDAEIAYLQEIVRTQAEEAAKATYYYTDKMDELKKECDALAGALRAHEQHMGEAQHTCVRYLVPAADPIRIEKEQFVSEMLGHFDGPEQRAVQEKANAALAQYAAI